MKNKLQAAVLLSLFVCVFTSQVLAQAPAPERFEAKFLQSLVRNAAALVAEKGEDAFPEFRKPGSQWYHGEVYIFVLDAEGKEYVNPVKPEMEGQSQIDLKDVGGKPFVRDYLELVAKNPEGEAWAHFQWHRPPSDAIEWKTAFLKRVKTPAGKEYIVGSGLYNIPMEKIFLVDTVQNAVRLIQEKGADAFKVINDKTSQFQYEEVYVFVLNDKGIRLANQNLKLLGTSAAGLKDINGKEIFGSMIAMLQTEKTGWLEYWWPRPGETAPSNKTSYIERTELNGEMLIVGAGIYFESLGLPVEKQEVVGTWELKDTDGSSFISVLNEDGSALSNWGPGEIGSWKIESGQVVVSWTDGWHDILIKNENGFQKSGYAPGVLLTSEPTNHATALKLKEVENGLIGSWLTKTQGSGNVILTYRKDHTYGVDLGADKTEDITGIYQIDAASEERISLKDVTGKLEEQCKSVTGVYHYHISSNSLNHDQIEDACPPRMEAFHTLWFKQG